ncbi:MAG: ABC transporter ATP-binding protein [Oscillospiraceae bacterium]|nr:ABC transporter ATP-binding protein [Oscillospiraceae bacterium]
MNAVELNNISKTYKDFSLSNLSLNVPTGSIVGLVGENGAGKSTTIKLIMNVISPDAGTIKVFGKPNNTDDFISARDDIGVVLDESYFPEIISASNVDVIMKNTYRNWNSQQYLSYIQKFSLPLKKPFRDFSRGMKMKLAIAVAMSHAPKLLILDEATSGLDPMVRDEMLDIFNDFTRNEENSILISSHIVSDLEKICDYIAFIHQGRLVLCEEKDRLIQEYAIVKLTADKFESIPDQAVKSKKVTPYGVEALVKRSLISSSFRTEYTTLEDIILFLAKGDTNK